MSEEIISNRFIRVLDEWIDLSYQEDHFKGFDSSFPHIKLCGKTGKIRANDAFAELPDELKEAMVAHEMGHRYHGHSNQGIDNPFYRLGLVVLRDSVEPGEIEADEYAADKLGTGKYIQALRDMLDLGLFESKSAKREIELRIEHQQRKFQ